MKIIILCVVMLVCKIPVVGGQKTPHIELSDVKLDCDLPMVPM